MNAPYLLLEQRAYDIRERAAEMVSTDAKPLIDTANDLERQAADMRRTEHAELQEMASRGQTATPAHTDDTAIASFREYLRSGEVRDSSSTVDANGGYLVPHPLKEELVRKVYDSSPIYREARVFQTEGQNRTLELPVQSAHSQVSWGTEVSARGETDGPEFGLVSIAAEDVWAHVYATSYVLDSSDIESIIVEDLAKAVMHEANKQFTIGSDVNKPKGIFANHTGDNAYDVVLSGSSSVLVHSKIIEAQSALPSAYQQNAKWYTNPATFATIAQMSRGATLTTHPLVEFGPAGQKFILGKEVVFVDDAPNVGSAAFPLAYGDLSRAYAIVEHRAFGVLRNPFNPPYVRFYALTRLGGQPWDKQALVLCKSHNS